MKEFELLKYLMSILVRCCRDQILENVWGYDFMGSNVIEVYIAIYDSK